MSKLFAFLIVLAFNLVMGALMFDYCLFTIFGKNVPWYVDMVAGLFLAEPLLPITIICWIATLCGVSVPFVK